MNRKTTLSGFVALALVVVSSIQAAGRGFVRPTGGYAMPEEAGYKDAPYVGFAAGTFVGKSQAHEFSAEAGYIRWENFFFWVSAEENYLPLLASYRYYFQAFPKVRLFAGPSIGLTRAAYDVDVYDWNSGRMLSDSSEKFLFTWAATAGVNFQFTETLSFDLAIATSISMTVSSSSSVRNSIWSS